MSQTLSWIAVRGLPPEEVRDRLGIRVIAPGDDLPEATCTACALPGDWYLIQFSTAGAVTRHGESIVASGAEVIVGTRDLDAARCSATAWKQAAGSWSVAVMDGTLRVGGDLPSEIGPTIEQSRDAPDGEVPLAFPFEAARDVLGYHPDQSTLPWELAEILDPAPGPAHMAGAGKFGCFGLAVAAVGVLLALGQ